MGLIQLLPTPRDASALVNYLNNNFKRIADEIGLLARYRDNDDLEITDSSKGLILTSPNGSRYRITVTNAGALTITLL